MKKVLLVSGLCLLLVIIGLSLWDQQQKAVVLVRARAEAPYQVPVSQISQGKLWWHFQDDDYKQLSDFAMMSYDIYQGQGKQVCPPAYPTAFGTESAQQHLLANWTLLRPIPEFPVAPRHARSIAGLMYDVWVSKIPAQPRTAVIVFRGTDASEWGDWYSNGRWATKYISNTWDQYEQVIAMIPTLVEAIQQTCGRNCRIFTTGHSLGGGLAQQAAYASRHITKVFAFDPSTVTGFYSIPSEIRPINAKGKRIYRIYEKGEVLSILRAGMKMVYPLSRRDPQIIEVRYNLMSGNMVSQHSIQEFATCLLKCSPPQTIAVTKSLH